MSMNPDAERYSDAKTRQIPDQSQPPPFALKSEPLALRLNSNQSTYPFAGIGVLLLTQFYGVLESWAVSNALNVTLQVGHRFGDTPQSIAHKAGVPEHDIRTGEVANQIFLTR